MAVEKPIKKVVSKVSRTKVSIVAQEPLISLAASMAIILEAIQNEKPKEKGEVADVLTGHKF